MSSSLKTYEDTIKSLTAESAGMEIRKGMTDIAKQCVSIGFYLKAVRDRKLYQDMGYENLWDYAADQFGLSMSSTSRYIAINDRFSVDGNTPQLLPEYSGFSKSQLQEMLNMSPEQTAQVTEDMTVKEIRKLKKPEQKKDDKDNLPKEIPEEKFVATSQEYVDESATCPPGISQCIRQEWGISPEEQRKGHKECVKCWNDWKKRKSAREPEKKDEKPLSVYGLPLREYPEGSLIATPGCGTHDCFSCHQSGCGIRKQFCYCVEAPMGNPFPCEMLDKVPELQEKLESCQFLDHSLAYHRAGDGEAVPCCKDCENLCVSLCSRAGKALEEMGLTILKEPDRKEADEQSVPDAAEGPEESGLSDMELLRSMLRKENDWLSKFLKVDKVEKLPEDMIRKKKLMVGALASMLSDLEVDAEPEAAGPEQPVLPPMKNNEQRKEWLRSYKAWGLWYEDANIGAKYYKYDFENGARLIAETYVVPASKYTPEHETYYLHLVGGPEPERKNSIPKWERHEIYNRYADSETGLVEFLKAVQKKGADKDA